MRKYFTALIFVSAVWTNVEATAKNAGVNPQINWSKELDLSKEQKAQVKEIYEQSNQKIKSLMQQIDTLHNEIADIRKNDEAKIRTLLNEKQQVKFDKAQARLNKGNPEFKTENGKKPSRKRMRQYGSFQN